MNRFMISVVLFAAACGGKKDEPGPSTGSAPTAGSATGSAAAGSAVAVAAGSGSAAAGSGSAVAAGSAAPVAAKEIVLPTAEDFEEDSTKRITEKNVDTEVKALEKEIGEN